MRGSKILYSFPGGLGDAPAWRRNKGYYERTARHEPGREERARPPRGSVFGKVILRLARWGQYFRRAC